MEERNNGEMEENSPSLQYPTQSSEQSEDTAKVNSSWRTALDSMAKRWAAVWKLNPKQFPHDVTFVVGDDRAEKEMIPCHKLVLCVASPVFENMIRQVESQEGKQLTIELPKVHIRAFKDLLRQYIYQGELEEVSLRDACAALSLANRFEIPELQNHYSDHIYRGLSKTTAVIIYQETNDCALQNLAYNIILSNFEDILHSDDFLRLTETNLCKILAADELCVYSEVDLFKAVKRWTRKRWARAGQRSTDYFGQMIKHVVYCIRIPTMTLEEFISIVEPSGLLCHEDTTALMNYFAKRQTNRNYIDPDMKFSTQMRDCKKKDIMVPFYLRKEIHSERRSDDFHEYISERFRLTGNYSPIYLKAVGFVNPRQVVKTIYVKIENENTKEIITVTEKTQPYDVDEIFVEFDSPVHMKINTTYKISYKPLNGGLYRLSNSSMKREKEYAVFKHPYIPSNFTSVEIIKSYQPSADHDLKRRKVENENFRYIHSLKFSF